MDPSLEDLLQLPLPEPPIVIETWPDGERFTFDDAEYDADTDRLRLIAGPPSAANVELTPEGHIVHSSIPDRRFSGLVLTRVADRLERFGQVDVTLGPTQYVALRIDDLAMLMTRARARRVRRFERRG
jgi:hypothetical protein